MKIKKIAAICKRTKKVFLYNRLNADGEITAQFVGDGIAAYPVLGLPVMDEKSMLTVFDVPEKDRSGWNVYVNTLPELVSFQDTQAGERPVGLGRFSVLYQDKTLRPVETSRGVLFIEDEYLSLVMDAAEVLELYERRSEDNRTVIAVKAGLLLYAVIMPSAVVNEDFTEQLRNAAAQCTHWMELERVHRNTGSGEAEGQTGLWTGMED